MEILNIRDLVKVTTTSTGNGVLTLTDTAADNFRTFTEEYGGDTSNIPVVVKHQSTDEWQSGIVSFDLSSLEITWTRVINNHNGNTTPVSFSSGTKDVYVSLSAEFYTYLQANLSPTKRYTPTLTPCSNTTTPTDILSVTIPANDWADGEKIVIDLVQSNENNIASCQLEVSYGSDSYLAFNSQLNNTVLRQSIELWRIGTSIYIYNASATADNDSSLSAVIPTALKRSDTGSSDYEGDFGTILTGVTFNSSKDLVITATFDTADAGDSIEILAAKVVKI